MEYIARVGKVWKNKRTSEIHGRNIKIDEKDSIDNYAMVREPAGKPKITFIAKKEDKHV